MPPQPESDRIWRAILRRLQAGEMPPTGVPAAEKTPLATVTAWITSNFGAPNSGARPAVPDGDPGRVTIRRLNRTEYDNTIRDLLGVGGHPADEFPIDDSGYGFDNNGDVLSLSPLLMEKYLDAAAKVSRVAVYGPDLPAKPGLLVKLVPSAGPTGGAQPSGSAITILPFSIRGIASAIWVFPKNAEYEFRFIPRDWRGFLGGGGDGNKPADGTARGPRPEPTPEQTAARKEALIKQYPPAKYALWVDGKQALEGSHAGGYGIDNVANAEEVARVPLAAGEHSIRVAFVDAANLADPLMNLLSGKNFLPGNHLRALEIGDIDIRGPFNPDSARPASYQKIFICTEENAACAKRIVSSLATRAFRRPATDAEISRLYGICELLQKQGKGFQEGIRAAVEAVLLSPDFLFRAEADPRSGPQSVTNIHPVSDYELASRLSYFLWSTMPDDELFQAAAERRLRKPGVPEAELKRMLADPKANQLIDNFTGQWLGLRGLSRQKPDPDRFPSVDDDLLADMATETKMFFAAVVNENRSIFDFVDGRFTYLNGPLAAHYGIPGIAGPEFRRVELTGKQRSGVLTQAAVLTVSSFTTRTSVVTRGKWVLENLLGTPPPPPPPDVPSLKDTDIGTTASLRERMEQHRANPACAACHKRMDPIGFGLENYDASGKWRTMDGKFPIDASGVLPDGTKFNGAAELKGVLRSQSDLFARNLTEKMLTYALGRGVESYDAPTIDEILKHLKENDYRMDTLLLEVIKSRAFQMRDGAIQ